MARLTLVALLIAVVGYAADAPPDPNTAFAQSLAVQMALKQGREALQKGDTKAAIANRAKLLHDVQRLRAGEDLIIRGLATPRALR